MYSITRFGVVLGLSLLRAAPAAAETIWTSWMSDTAGSPGSASGSLSGVTVSYHGEVDANTVINGTSADWSEPASSFIGGASTTSPGIVGDIITENGSYTGTNTLTFASRVTDPLIAIWSLGAPGNASSYTFSATPTFEAGGPDTYGGGPITVSGDVVSGQEGSGVIEFTGSFSSISWTDTFENYYGFTVGEAAETSSTPELPTFLLFVSGLVAFSIWQVRA